MRTMPSFSSFSWTLALAPAVVGVALLLGGCDSGHDRGDRGDRGGYYDNGGRLRDDQSRGDYRGDGDHVRDSDRGYNGGYDRGPGTYYNGGDRHD